MDDKDVQYVVETCERLDKIMTRYVAKLSRDRDTSVAISIVTNMATTVLANALAMMATHGKDLDPIMDTVLQATFNKYKMISADIEAAEVLSKIMSASKDPSSPLH